jgi:hypothetical protein
MGPEAVLIEIRRVGPALRVAAFDPATLIEVSFQAPIGTPTPALRRLGLAKLAQAVARSESPGAGRPR